MKWIESEEASFGERLLAFACVEGIFFSGSFAAIFWLRKRGLMKGLAQANAYYFRDEGLHQRFACLLYRKYLKHSKPSPERAYQIVKEACELEKEFQTECLTRFIDWNQQGIDGAIHRVCIGCFIADGGIGTLVQEYKSI